MLGEEFQKINAKSVLTYTLVGYIIQEFPSSRGNCFSVLAEDGERYDVVNFNIENLKELERRKEIEFPILMHKLGKGTVVFADPRIPNEWYSTRFCETCTPRSLLPYPQKLKIELDILRGIREEKVVEIDGKQMRITTINVEPKIRKR